MKEQCNYIEPIEIPLDYRKDKTLNRETGTFMPKRVLDTCQYVPVIETLKLVLSNRHVFEAIHSETPSSFGKLNSFIDSDHFKNHPFLQVHKHALRIQFYYNELEIVNPLGSKTGVHKLGAFYYVIQNVPAHMNSELSSIHVLMLCSDFDVKRYGFQKILSPFFSDLEKLESDNGVEILLGGINFTLRATLAAFIGDTLAIHQVYNFKGPAAKLFCRACLYSRENLIDAKLDSGERGTKQVYNEQLEYVKNSNFSEASMTETGIKGDCCSHKSKFFQLSQNKVWDEMHDILCHGVGEQILKLVLHQYVSVDNFFTIDWFKEKIHAFQFGQSKSNANVGIVEKFPIFSSRNG